MADIFFSADVLKLLYNKHVVFIGDSNVRAIYKDVLWLMTYNSLTSKNAFKRKLEASFMGDRLLKGDRIHRGRSYEEIREFKGKGTHLEFCFITRVYSPAIEKMMADIKQKKRSAPDVIVMNSCVWDITRWGPNSVPEYKDNLVKVMKLFQQNLPEKTLMIWLTTLPMSSNCRGGFLIKQVEFMKYTMRFDIMEANMFARQEVVSHGFDVLDLHYHLRMQIHRRAEDGIHWHSISVRHMTNLILTHIALAWDCPLPGNFESKIVERIKETMEEEREEDATISLPTLPEGIQEKPSEGLQEKSPKRNSSRSRRQKRWGRERRTSFATEMQQPVAWNRPLPDNFDATKETMEAERTEGATISFPTFPEGLQEKPPKTNSSRSRRRKWRRSKGRTSFVTQRQQLPAYAYGITHQENYNIYGEPLLPFNPNYYDSWNTVDFGGYVQYNWPRPSPY